MRTVMTDREALAGQYSKENLKRLMRCGLHLSVGLGDLTPKSYADELNLARKFASTMAPSSGQDKSKPITSIDLVQESPVRCTGTELLGSSSSISR
jgi:hypothetical protein